MAAGYLYNVKQPQPTAMFLLYTLLSAVFAGAPEERKPRTGKYVYFVQPGYRNAYDGYHGKVEFASHGEDGYYGFSLYNGHSTLNCFGMRYQRKHYRLPGSSRVYKW
jgi:hypothetical protein